MKHYEMLCVMPGTFSEDEVQKAEQKVTELLEKLEIKGATIEDMGKSRLAYPMKHIRYGYFRLFRFESEGKNIPELQAKLRLFEELLRSVIQSYDPAKMSDKKINYVAGGTISHISREKPSSRDRDNRNNRRNAAPVKTEAPAEEAKTEETDKGNPSTEAQESKEEKKEDINLDAINEKLDNILNEDIAKDI